MAGRPKTREKKAKAALKEIEAELAAEQEPAAYPPQPEGGKGRSRGASAERMREITRLRMEAAKTDPSKKGGRPRVQIDGVSREEAEQRALDELTPRALKVLKEQLESPDEGIRQRAAIKVIEYRMGKPTQRIEQESRVAVIRYESAAWTYGQHAIEGELVDDMVEIEA